MSPEVAKAHLESIQQEFKEYLRALPHGHPHVPILLDRWYALEESKAALDDWRMRNLQRVREVADA